MPPVAVFPRTFFWSAPILGCLAVFGAGCAKQQAAPAMRPAIPVVVAKVTTQTMPVEVTSVGNVEAISTVSIKAQVAGELQEVRFKEGDFVRRGQILFTIDPRPYQASLAQAQAALNRDKATAANNRVQADRYVKLLQEGIMPATQVDSFTSAADASDAVVSADEAAIKIAQLNLEYCSIVSPIDGRTGTIMLKPGNLVKVADVPIVVINEVDPIYVNFTVPQQYWPDVKERMSRGAMRVTANIPQDTGAPLQGDLTFVDNAVDATTGTIHLRGTFANGQSRLWPGLFVNTVLTLSDEPNATVVPAQAVTPGQNGATVYVLTAGDKVEQRAVVADRTINGETVVSKGLEPGETVVVDGQVNLTPGAKVEIKNKPSEADPQGTAAPRKGGQKQD